MKLKWIVFWIAGVFAGTLLVNFNHSLLLDTQLQGLLETSEIDWNHLFFFVLQRRLIPVLLAVFLSLTFFFSPATMLFCFYFGFTTGAMTAAATTQYGLLGIVFYSGTIFPQILLYAPMWFLLVSHCMKTNQMLHHWQKGKKGIAALVQRIPAVVSIFVLLLAGVFLESYINPLFLKYLFDFM